jgi:hypothetical protein
MVGEEENGSSFSMEHCTDVIKWWWILVSDFILV